MSDDIPSVLLMVRFMPDIDAQKKPCVVIRKSDAGPVSCLVRIACWMRENVCCYSIMTESPGDFRQWLRVVELGT